MDSIGEWREIVKTDSSETAVSSMFTSTDDLFTKIEGSYALAHKAFLAIIIDISLRAPSGQFEQIQEEFTVPFVKELFSDIWARLKFYPDKERILKFRDETYTELERQGIKGPAAILLFCLKEFADGYESNATESES